MCPLHVTTTYRESPNNPESRRVQKWTRWHSTCGATNVPLRAWCFTGTSPSPSRMGYMNGTSYAYVMVVTPGCTGGVRAYLAGIVERGNKAGYRATTQGADRVASHGMPPLPQQSGRLTARKVGVELLCIIESFGQGLDVACIPCNRKGREQRQDGDEHGVKHTGLSRQHEEKHRSRQQ